MSNRAHKDDVDAVGCVSAVIRKVGCASNLATMGSGFAPSEATLSTCFGNTRHPLVNAFAGSKLTFVESRSSFACVATYIHILIAASAHLT